jgi:hypothetical protein
MKNIWQSIFGNGALEETEPDFDVNILGMFCAEAGMGEEFVVGERPWITFRHPLDNSFTENYPLVVGAELVIQ